MKMKMIVVASFMLWSESLAGQWRITRLDLDVEVKPEVRTLLVSGTAKLATVGSSAARAVLVFGPGGVTFDSVRADPAALVSITRNRDSAVLGSTDAKSLNVTFFAHSDHDLGRSLVRNEGAMISWGAQWYPVLAPTDTSGAELRLPGFTRITVPSHWHTLSVGHLIDTAVTNGLRTERWEAVRPAARSFVAADFVPTWTNVGNTVVQVFLLPRHVSRMREYANAIPNMVRVLSSYFGPYPFSTFGIAELPREIAPPGFGGRSEPGYFIAHTDALEGAGVNVPLFAHELTHMWFPNAVDSRPPGDDMMDEAIANYGVVLYKQATEGEAAARRELIEGNPDFSVRGYFQDIRLGRDEPLMTDYSPLIARAKGPMVYDMLRRRVGDSTFFGVWRDLAARGGSASLADLRRMYLERASSDTGLGTFLSQWMDRKGAPIVELGERAGKGLSVTLKQRGLPYVMDMPLRIHQGRGFRDIVIHVKDTQQTFVFRNATHVELDPDDLMLLWKPRFGPPPDAPASWSTKRWRQWMDDEVTWLMRCYDVRGLSFAVINGGKAIWTPKYGTAAPSVIGLTRALGRSVAAGEDTVTINRLTSSGDDVELVLDRPRDGVGVVIVARGGWGGRQLTRHIAQRVAIQYKWKVVPH